MRLPKVNIKDVTETEPPVDDIDFSDHSIKYSIDTSPLKSGGSNFKTNVLIQKSSSKLVYKPSIGSGLFSFLFLAVGIGIIFFSISPLFKASSKDFKPEWFLIVFGLVFSSVGSFLFYTFYKPRVFDKQLGFYYSAYKMKLHNNSKANIPLKSIIALQIIGEYVKGDKGSYKSFELNLILNDGSRKNVIDHGNLKSIIDDAHVISEFLNIPIWHSKSSEDQ